LTVYVVKPSAPIGCAIRESKSRTRSIDLYATTQPAATTFNKRLKNVLNKY